MKRYYAISAIITLFAVSLTLLFSYLAWKEQNLVAPTEFEASPPLETSLSKPLPPKKEEPVTEKRSETTITIGMIGDILLHEPMLYYGDYHFAFNDVKKQLQDMDFLLANIESLPGGQELGLSGYPKFNSPKAIVPALINSGVHFASIANNHVLDHGERQLQNTIATFKEYNLPYTGAFASEEDLAEMRVVDVEGVKVGILAYTYGTNLYKQSHPDGKQYLINIIEEKRVVRDLAKMKELADVTVLSLHWGTEYSHETTELQRRLSERFTEAGADIIFGHHTHVLQPMQFVNERPVFYSLGNFYSAQPWAGTNIGGIARVSLTKIQQGDDVTIQINDAHLHPTAVTQDAQFPNEKKARLRVRSLADVGNVLGYTVDKVEEIVGTTSWE